MKRVYIDMDGVLANYECMAKKLGYSLHDAAEQKGFFLSLEPMPGAIDAVEKLMQKYDVYILSAGSWTNPLSFSEKVDWIKKYFPALVKRSIFSDDKSLLNGDYLIDDRDVNRQREFNGEWLQFGVEPYQSWDDVLKKLL